MSAAQSREKPDNTEMQEFRENFTVLQAGMEDIKGSVTRLTTAITGDPEVGHRGIIQQLGDQQQILLKHDEKINAHSSRFLVWGAYIAALSTLISLAIAAYSARLVP